MSNNDMISVPRELLSTYLGGTDGDWVEAGHELRSLLAKPPAQLQGEPVAYAAFSDNGNIRCWSSNCEAVGLKILAEGGSEIVPLYRHPAEQSKQESQAA